MARLGKTCRAAREALRVYTEYAFSINRSLLRFFEAPVAFRAHQARTNALISGSFALQFFDRGIYEGSDLDVFCAYREDDPALGLWLLAEGYVFVPGKGQSATFLDALQDYDHQLDTTIADATKDVRPQSPRDFYDFFSIKTVCTFQKYNRRTRQNLQVQIIFTYNSPMDVIMGFHSSECFCFALYRSRSDH